MEPEQPSELAERQKWEQDAETLQHWGPSPLLAAWNAWMMSETIRRCSLPAVFLYPQTPPVDESLRKRSE
jgi:hypothetical protein